MHKIQYISLNISLSIRYIILLRQDFVPFIPLIGELRQASGDNEERSDILNACDYQFMVTVRLPNKCAERNDSFLISYSHLIETYTYYL